MKLNFEQTPHFSRNISPQLTIFQFNIFLESSNSRIKKYTISLKETNLIFKFYIFYESTLKNIN